MLIGDFILFKINRLILFLRLFFGFSNRFSNHLVVVNMLDSK